MVIVDSAMSPHCTRRCWKQDVGRAATPRAVIGLAVPELAKLLGEVAGISMFAVPVPDTTPRCVLRGTGTTSPRHALLTFKLDRRSCLT
jgi:hypothetical protein